MDRIVLDPNRAYVCTRTRYTRYTRCTGHSIIRAMNAAQRPQNKSPSNMELDFSSPETIPNASDNDQEDNKSLSSSITSTDDSHKTERSRLQKLTPPRTRVIDECNIEIPTDVNRKRTLPNADGDKREHTWESNSDNSKCDYTTRQAKGKAKLNSNEIDSNTTALVETSLDFIQPESVTTPATHTEPVTSVEPGIGNTLDNSTPVPPATIDSIPVITDVNTDILTESRALKFVYGEENVTITDGTVTINEPPLYLTLLKNGQMPPLEINTNWDYEDFDSPDFRSTPSNPNPSQYYIDGAGVLNIIPFSALVQNNSRVIDDRRRFKVPRHVDIPSDPKKSPNINRFGTTLVKPMNLQRNQVMSIYMRYVR